ncbi:hypothetical protein P3L10_010232 [Capsicum annuum]|uniref:uncharacterized protein LOC107865375 n=1 Tax=Capsicum annuum TaxID=4072 RepID=UPI0007BF2DA9|nr:uncharacterized protein LOC107865375 [Capsicum annuum]
MKGLNYEDFCIDLGVKLPEGNKPPKFELYNGTGYPEAHLRMYCDKLAGVGKNEKIWIKLFMRSLMRETLTWYIEQDMKKWIGWLNLASSFIDIFGYNIDNAPSWTYMQAMREKPNESFHEYAMRWRAEATRAWPLVEEQQIKEYFVKLIDTKVIQLKDPKPNIINNPLPTHEVNMIDAENNIDLEHSIWVIEKGDSTPISVRKQAPFDVQVAMPKAPSTVVRATLATYNPHAAEWNYTLNILGKAKIVEIDIAQRVTRSSRIYTPKNLFQGNSSKGKQPTIGVEEYSIFKKLQAKEYFVAE